MLIAQRMYENDRPPAIQQGWVCFILSDGHRCRYASQMHLVPPGWHLLKFETINFKTVISILI